MNDEAYQREHCRVNLQRYNIPLHYKFICPNKSFQCEEIFKGSVVDLSEGGAQICCPIPSTRLLMKLGTSQILMGINLMLPQQTLKMLGLVRWARTEPEEGCCHYRIGVSFTKLSDNDKKVLRHYLIHNQIETAKFHRMSGKK